MPISKFANFSSLAGFSTFPATSQRPAFPPVPVDKGLPRGTPAWRGTEGGREGRVRALELSTPAAAHVTIMSRTRAPGRRRAERSHRSAGRARPSLPPPVPFPLLPGGSGGRPPDNRAGPAASWPLRRHRWLARAGRVLVAEPCGDGRPP